jgi:hypothetical protein
MENEWPYIPDTRPIVAYVVLSAALTCCCLTAAAAGMLARWNHIRSIPPTPTAVPTLHQDLPHDPYLLHQAPESQAANTAIDLRRKSAVIARQSEEGAFPDEAISRPAQTHRHCPGASQPGLRGA